MRERGRERARAAGWKGRERERAAAASAMAAVRAGERAMRAECELGHEETNWSEVEEEGARPGEGGPGSAGRATAKAAVHNSQGLSVFQALAGCWCASFCGCFLGASNFQF
jgi:hypothetical protein